MLLRFACVGILIGACAARPLPASSDSEPTSQVDDGTGGAGTGAMHAAEKPAAAAASEATPGGRTTPTASPSGATAPTAAKDGAAPQLAEESTAPGITPLTADEQRESKAKCAPFMTKLRKQVRGGTGRLQRAELLLAKLDEPDAVDDERCRELLKRGLRAYLTATSESAAIIQLKTLLVGLSSYFERNKTLCPNAGPQHDDPAWACTKAKVPAGQRFQYRLRIDGTHYTLSATGAPLEGIGGTELFISGDVEDGAIELGAPVMRRAPSAERP